MSHKSTKSKPDVKSRDKLPYRLVAKCFLIKGRKLVCQMQKNYVQLPGGGIEKKEDPIVGLQREILEETGYTTTKPQFLTELFVDWTPNWHENKKERLARFKEFKGEHVLIYVAFAKTAETPTSKEGDAFSPEDITGHYLDVVIKALEDSLNKQLPEFIQLSALQIVSLKLLKMYLDKKSLIKDKPRSIGKSMQLHLQKLN